MRVKAPLAERGADLYETPAVATQALLRSVKLPKWIWEPACGPGAIVRVLRAAGHTVVASDLVDYQSPDQDFARRDFLLEQNAPEGIECIVTNPPFKLADDFVEHALRLCPKVVMLTRFTFLESVRRTAILENGSLARIHLFRNRLPMMHRAGWTGPKASSSTAYNWLVWDREHRGPPTFHRISWTDDPQHPPERSITP